MVLTEPLTRLYKQSPPHMVSYPETYVVHTAHTDPPLGRRPDGHYLARVPKLVGE